MVEGRDIEVDLAAGTATFRGSEMHMPDFHDFENSVLGNGETPTPAVVSFTVEWTATGAVQSFVNLDQRYRGNMRAATVRSEWAARSGIFEYTSTPLSESTSEGAQIGAESNGAFF